MTINTMRIFQIIFLVCGSGFLKAQPIDTTGFDYPYIPEIISYQKNLNHEYADPAASPLDSIDLVRFSSLNFYSPDLKYMVVATFTKVKKLTKFKMKTSTSRKPEYAKYGEVSFEIDGIKYKLNVYQNIEFSKKPGFEKYLFLPFTDLTSGETTYGGGRYIDLEIPEDNTIFVNFNFAYNPYCAYAHSYSCPIPPPENFLNTKIEAGVKEGLIYK